MRHQLLPPRVASWLSRSTAAVNSAIVGFMRSSSSNNSCRRRLAQGASESFSNCARPCSLKQFFLPAIALVHRQRLQLIHDPRAHLQPTDAGATTVVADLDSPDPAPRFEGTDFQQQLPHKSGISRSVFCFLTRLVLISAGSPIHTSNPNSASSRSNQREYPVASMPTRTCIPRCFRSR